MPTHSSAAPRHAPPWPWRKRQREQGRAAEGAPSHDAPQGGGGRVVPSCTPLTVPPPIYAQRMIRDATGNTKYEFGDGSKAIADGSKDAAEKVRGALVAW